MKLKNLISVMIVLFFPVTGGCMSILSSSGEKIVPYKSWGLMEYTFESNTLIIRIRCGYLVSGSQYPVNFRIENEIEDGHKRYFITFLFNHKPKEKIVSNIENPKWGTRVSIPINDFKENDTIYYKDEKSVYQIHRGTRETWRKHLLDAYREYLKPIYTDKERKEMLDDI